MGMGMDRHFANFQDRALFRILVRHLALDFLLGVSWCADGSYQIPGRRVPFVWIVGVLALSIGPFGTCACPISFLPSFGGFPVCV